MKLNDVKYEDLKPGLFVTTLNDNGYQLVGRILSVEKDPGAESFPVPVNIRFHDGTHYVSLWPFDGKVICLPWVNQNAGYIESQLITSKLLEGNGFSEKDAEEVKTILLGRQNYQGIRTVKIAKLQSELGITMGQAASIINVAPHMDIEEIIERYRYSLTEGIVPTDVAIRIVGYIVKNLSSRVEDFYRNYNDIPKDIVRISHDSEPDSREGYYIFGVVSYSATKDEFYAMRMLITGNQQEYTHGTEQSSQVSNS